jgi:uncharacterized glyoxalase superfamily protein PhnB
MSSLCRRTNNGLPGAAREIESLEQPRSTLPQGNGMSVSFQRLRPMLRTKDLHGTVTFWTERLGFTCQGVSEADGWASMSRNDVSVMIATPNAHVPFDAPAFTGSFYFDVDDATALWAELKDRVKIAYPLETFEYGMCEFAIYDNNGYMLQFGTPVRR